MTHFPAVARAALTAMCVVQGIAQVAIDLNRTHAIHPLWPGHARFHVVWQSLTVLLLSGASIVLVWTAYMPPRTGLILAALLAAISPVAFLLAALLRKSYGGTFSDPKGIGPWRFRLGGSEMAVDMNLAAVIGALISLGVIVTVF